MSCLRGLFYNGVDRVGCVYDLYDFKIGGTDGVLAYVWMLIIGYDSALNRFDGFTWDYCSKRI